MHPILFNLGSFPVHSYGVLIAIGFLLAVLVVKRDGIRNKISGERMVDLSFWSLLIGMAGARILYVITRLDYFAAHPLEIFYVWEGGLVFFGGLLACVPFFMWFTKKYSMPRWKVLDICAGAVPLAHAFGRMGCFSAGCCYGKPTEADWGVKFFSPLVERSLHGVYLHPTQLYESGSLLLLFFALRLLQRRKQFDGQVITVYFIAYSIIRSIIELFRGDDIRGFVIDGVLSTSQFISLLVIIGALVVYFKRRQAWRSNLASA